MKLLEGALISGLMVAVICFGGTEPVSFAAVQILFFAMAVRLAIKPDSASAVLRPTHLVVPGLLLAIGLLQLCPLPAKLVGLLGTPPDSHRGSHWEALSLGPYQTRAELLVLLTCVVTFVFAIVASAERSRKRRVIYCLLTLGTLEAFYGLIQYLANWQNIFWYAKKYDLQEATGTYINHNHFAGLLEMTLPFAVCLALYEAEKAGFSRKTRSRYAPGLSSNLPKVVLWLVVSVIVAAGIVFSRSRMGLLCAGASLIVVLGVNALQRKAVPVALTAAFLVLTFSFAAWIGLRPALNRFENVGQELSGQQESRLSVWPGALKVIRERPWIGSGLGTFPIAYTAFQSTFLTKFMNHAHNDYLELSADLGIPAAIALFGSIAWVLWHGIRTVFHSASRFERNVSLACVGSIAAILLHSLADFNLYIPANALVLATILGIALATSPEASRVEAAA